MGEIGSGNGSAYPGALDTDNVPETANDFVRLQWGNDVAACIVAVENALGASPAGTAYATAAARLASISHPAGGVPRGPAANRPAANQGTIYLSTDQGTLEFSDGVAWHAFLTG